MSTAETPQNLDDDPVVIARRAIRNVPDPLDRWLLFVELDWVTPGGRDRMTFEDLPDEIQDELLERQERGLREDRPASEVMAEYFQNGDKWFTDRGYNIDYAWDEVVIDDDRPSYSPRAKSTDKPRSVDRALEPHPDNPHVWTAAHMRFVAKRMTGNQWVLLDLARDRRREIEGGLFEVQHHIDQVLDLEES